MLVISLKFMNVILPRNSSFCRMSTSEYILQKEEFLGSITFINCRMSTSEYTRPRIAVGNVSGYRCVSDCRSRGREFDPGPVPYFRGD